MNSNETMDNSTAVDQTVTYSPPPVADPSSLIEDQELISEFWPGLKEHIHDISVWDLIVIPMFQYLQAPGGQLHTFNQLQTQRDVTTVIYTFPVDEHLKWEIYDTLSKQLSIENTNLLLLLQQSILALQCGIYIQSYSNALQIIHLLNLQTINKQKEKESLSLSSTTPSTNPIISTEDLMKQVAYEKEKRFLEFIARCLLLLTTMLINDCKQYYEIWYNYINTLEQLYPRTLNTIHLLPSFPNLTWKEYLNTIGLQVLDPTIVDVSEMIFNDDHVLGYCLELESLIDCGEIVIPYDSTSNDMMIMMNGGTTILSWLCLSMTIIKKMMIMVQVDNVKRSEFVHEQEEKGLDGTIDRMIQAMKSNDKNYNAYLLPLAIIHLPLEYRCGTGGDRHPDTVLSTIHSIASEREGNVLEYIDVVIDSDKGGYKMIAKVDIPCDTVIYMEPPLLSFSTVSPELGKECAHCLTLLHTTESHEHQYRCQQCGDVYCSEHCQTLAWREYHQVICGIEWKSFIETLQLKESITSHSLIIITTIKLMIYAECYNLTIYQLPVFKILKRLTDTNNVNDNNKLILFPYGGELIMNNWKLFLFYCPNVLKYHKLYDLIIAYSTIRYNAFGGNIHDSNDVVEAGDKHSYLHSIASFANHSCNPNTNWEYNHYNGNSLLTFKSNQAINKDDEITISYFPSASEVKPSVLFKRVWGIECQCPSCTATMSSIDK